MSVLLLSGGLDSMILLSDLLSQGVRPLCLTVNYGQRHAKEIGHAAAVCEFFRCEHKIVTATGIAPQCALLGSGDVPRGFWFDAPEQSATVVPGRNAIFISIAAAHASQRKRKTVWIACHASDEAVYRDCRERFISRINEAMVESSDVSVVAPYIKMSRADVVSRGKGLGAPFHLAWSCYVGGEEPCGTCGACVERAYAGG